MGKKAAWAARLDKKTSLKPAVAYYKARLLGGTGAGEDSVLATETANGHNISFKDLTMSLNYTPAFDDDTIESMALTFSQMVHGDLTHPAEYWEKTVQEAKHDVRDFESEDPKIWKRLFAIFPTYCNDFSKAMKRLDSLDSELLSVWAKFVIAMTVEELLHGADPLMMSMPTRHWPSDGFPSGYSVDSSEAVIRTPSGIFRVRRCGARCREHNLSSLDPNIQRWQLKAA